MYTDEELWNELLAHQGETFHTANGLEFTYTIRGSEMFVSRKDKSITRSSIVMSYRKALELGGAVAGPKKLGTFGASYIFPVFIRLGVIH